MGQRVKCGACGTELEVVWLDPVELDWPYDEDDEEFDEEYEDTVDD
jgi:lysine biosynthesis protein LysW